MGFLVLVLGDLLMRSRGLFRGNAARRALRPVSRRFAPIHPRRLAHNGDSGRGIDNSQPWYQVYWIVDLTPDLDEVVTSAARDAGYHLHVDHELIDRLPRSDGSRAIYPGRFNPTSSYLTAEHGGRVLKASITRDGEVTVYAYGRGVTYGTRKTPPAGKAIVLLGLTLPDLR